MSASGHDRVAAMLGERIDLTAVDTSKPRPWLSGAHRILRPGVKAMWFSARGIGKSLAALLFALQVIEEGGSVCYLDLENGVRRQAERLAAVLADRDPELALAVAERLDYRPSVRLTVLDTPELRDAWAQSFASFSMVVIDSAARPLAQLGLDESSNADFSRFAVDYIDPIAERGPAVVLLDNSGWGDEQRSRGASNKFDLSELVYRVASDSVSPDSHGTIRLERVRTRDGDEAVRLEVGAGGGTYGRLAPSLPGDAEQQLQQALLEHVHDQPGQSTAQVAKAVRKRKDDARSQLEILERGGTVHRGQSERADRAGRVVKFTGWYPAAQSQTTLDPTSGTDQDPAQPDPLVDPGSPPLKAGPGPGTPQYGTNGHGSDEDRERAERLLAEHRDEQREEVA